MVNNDVELHIATATRDGVTNRWERGTTTWGEVRRWTDEPADHKECGAYVLGELSESRRAKDTIVGRRVLALDADEKAHPDLPDAVEVLGLEAVVHTTFSSTPAQPRYRVLVLLNRTVTPDEYRILAGRVMRKLGADQFDSGSAQPERFMYRPSEQEPGAFRRWLLDGDPLDVDAVLAEADEVPPQEVGGATAAPGYDGPAYEDLSDDLKDRAAGYVQARLDKWRAQFDGIEDWPEGQRDDHEPEPRGWERIASDFAYWLAKVAAAPWSPWDEGEAEGLYQEFLPSVVRDAPGVGNKWPHTWTKALREPSDVPPWVEPEFGVIADDSPESGDTPAGEVTTTADSRFAAEVEREVRRQRVMVEARQQIARESAYEVPIPSLVSLTEFLAQPDSPTRYRVDRLWPSGGRVVVSAQHKAGKTTLTGNLLRSLVDGDKFLGEYTTEPAERVVLIDNELSADMIRGWLRDQSIEATASVDVLPLRGKLSSFNVLDPATRERWAEAIGPADVLIFDCLRPALDALALSEDKDAGRFLEAMDELTAAAGIGELLIVHHMGHSNERSRGDSRILDWPDAVWKVVRADADDPTSERYFSAYGRDVDQPESRLAFDPLDRHLVVVGGSRAQERTSRLEVAVAEFVRHNPGATQTAIEQGVTGDRMNVRRAIHSLVDADVLRIEREGQARRHYENDDHKESLL